MKKKILTMIFLAIFVMVGGGFYWVYKNQQVKEAAPASVDLAAFLKEQNKNNSIVDSASKKDADQKTVLADDSKEKVLVQADSAQSIALIADSSQEVTSETGSSAQNIPKNLNFSMTFYSQAPLGNWAAPWQESCEEASILLVANLYQQKNWSVSEFNQQILQLVEWEKKRFSSYEHTDVAQTALMINEYLGLKTVIRDNPSFEDIQNILNKGHLIVMTFAGKKLNNPFYSNGGPNYHAMVIKGYKEDEKIITEDVGTRRGEDYVYKWSVLENALHDYAEPIENGPKRLIEIFPLNSI